MDALLKYFPELSEPQQEQFQKFKTCFLDWNDKINLISRKDTESFIERHVLHSLAIAKVLPFQDNSTILDVGTGGGFPGLPLAILFPHVQFTLVDSIGKKIKVVKDIAQQLQLNNVAAYHKRAENIDGEFDFVISRAVTRMKGFIPWVEGKFKSENNHSTPNGILYLKGGDLQEELSEIKEKSIVYNISDYFDEDFFETKKVVYISMN